jgi:EF-P beta-lysylation protein EpmB
MRNGSTNQSGKILATSEEFVPTAFHVPGELSGMPLHEFEQVHWQVAMKRAIRSGLQLRKAVGLSPDSAEVVDPSGKLACEQDFPTFAPLEFVARIEPGNPDDPLLKQILPVAAEQVEQAGFAADPVGDLNALVSPGVLHKYEGRALILTTAACGIHCRYCFRREFPYQETGSRKDDWLPSIEYLKNHSDVEEVILSGGDPLTTLDEKLDKLITALEGVPHLKRLRIHSRMPIVIPQRITEELVKRLSSSRLAVWMVIHANHPQELSEGVLSRLAHMIDAGIPVLNQAVLLRGVNDQAETLIELCRRLVNHRIQPYYLHQLDRVRGAAHFEVPVETGLKIIESLRAVLPGFAVPQYVYEEPGAKSKSPLLDNTFKVN